MEWLLHPWAFTELMGTGRRLDKIWYLARLNLLAGIGESEMQRLAERTTMREFGRGEGNLATR